MIGFNFGGFDLDIITLLVEVKLGNEITERQQLSGPYQMVAAQCQEAVNNVANNSQPMKITMYGEKYLEMPNGDCKAFPSRLTYANNAYLANFDIEE